MSWGQTLFTYFELSDIEKRFLGMLVYLGFFLGYNYIAGYIILLLR